MQTDPNTFKKVIDEQYIRSETIRWMCTDKEAMKSVTNKGIQIEGASFSGIMDLSFCEIPFPISLKKCSIMVLDMSYSTVPTVALKETWCPSLQALSLNVKGNLILDGINNTFGIDLRQAKIAGTLSFHGAKIISIVPNGMVLDCTGIQVNDSVHLDELSLNGKTSFVNSKINNDLSIYNSKMMTNFNAMRSSIGGLLFINETKVDGRLSFDNSFIGSVECKSSNFANENDITFSGNHLTTGGNCEIYDKFQSHGAIYLQGAIINGHLNLGGDFVNGNGAAIQADGISIKGSLFLKNKANITGSVNLIGSNIGGNFECDGAIIKNENKKALWAQGLNIGGSVFLRDGFECTGEVDILGSKIKGGIDCSGGMFINDSNIALMAQNLNVALDICLGPKFISRGTVDISNSVIGGGVFCNDANFSNPKKDALMACNTNIEKDFVLSGSCLDGDFLISRSKINGCLQIDSLSIAGKSIVDLRLANVNHFYSDANGWPSKNNLYLNGLTYNSIYLDVNTPEGEIEWIRLQNKFHEQPYEQLASYYKRVGDGDKAVYIYTQEAKDKIRISDMSLIKRLLYRLLGPTTGYGYKPLRALYWIIGFILFGSIAFKVGYKNEIITPRPENKKGLKFNCLWYSVDCFIPVVDFHEEEEYIYQQRKWSGLLRFYRFVHIILGWVFFTLLALGLSGLIKV